MGPLLAPLVPFLHPLLAPSLLLALRAPVDEKVRAEKGCTAVRAWRATGLAAHESTLMVLAALYGLVCHSAQVCILIGWWW